MSSIAYEYSARVAYPFLSPMAAIIVLTCTLTLAADDSAQQRAVECKNNWAPEIRRAFSCDDLSLWSNGTRVSSPRKSGAGAIKWDRHLKTPSLECKVFPHDLSAFNVMSFWMHSNQASDATFMVILHSARDDEVFSYFANRVTVDWTGWKRVELHFRSFSRAREPVGWQKIDRFRFTASGWDQRPKNGLTWVLDDLDFDYTNEPYRPTIDFKQYVDDPGGKEFLNRLRKDHPRLILLDDDLPKLRRFIENDPRGQAWYARAKAEAESLYKRPVRRHELPDGRRLLSISRDEVNRIYHWGFLYRMEGDRKWLERAWQELNAVVSFPDWNPNHYLDTAEMMHAVAIGYDWFYNDWTDDQRKTIREGLWQHGLRLSHAAYMGIEAEGMQSWRLTTNNWNFVCNGGTGLAAMALLDEMPEPCSAILELGFQYIQIPLQHFEPDGAWWEGVGYWGYAMRYFVPYLRGLETAFGTDFGMIDGLKGSGFEQAGDFPVYLVTPLGGIYNFADSGSGSGTFSHSHLFYLANRFQNPLYQYFQERQTAGSLTDLLYYQPLHSELAIEALPLDKYFSGTEVATMCSDWGDQNSLYVGIKCGRNGIAHAHQDLGSFIFYADGEKWLIDLGTEKQTYLGHQHSLSRSSFYRIREEGHNTLVFDPASEYCQDSKGEAKIVRFETSSDDVFAIADLTDAYRSHAKSVKRGYRLLANRTALLVQDEFQTKKPSDVWWFAHGAKETRYKISDAGKTVILRRDDKLCRARLLSPSDGVFAVVDAKPFPTSPNPKIQNPNDGLKKLVVHLSDRRKATIAVLFVPQQTEGESFEQPLEITPLDDWQLPAASGSP